MQRFEYKVIPAPNRAKKVRGVKTPGGRFALMLTDTINEQAAEGWEYLRSDSLPVEEKPGLLKSRVENYYTVLVFRKPVAAHGEQGAPGPDAPVAAPALGTPAPAQTGVATADAASGSAAASGAGRSDPKLSHPARAEARTEARAEPQLDRRARADSAPAEPPMRGGDKQGTANDQADDSPSAEPRDRDHDRVRDRDRDRDDETVR